MSDHTRRGILSFILSGPVLVMSVLPAMADKFSGNLVPGKTVTIPTADRNRRSQIKITNLGPGTAEIFIKSRGFTDDLVIEEGDVLVISEYFGTKRTEITNKSTSAIIRIESKWL